MNKIVYLNQKLLVDSRVAGVLDQHNVDQEHLRGLIRLNPGVDSNYIRAGENIHPFKNNGIEIFNFEMPTYDPAFSLSFSDVTDRRLAELRAVKNDQRWLVWWSGGIDSTVIVASILKNLSVSERANIDIACNRISIYENPTFYYNHIKPNFSIIDSNFLEINELLLKKYYVISGDPADQLYGGMASRNMIDRHTVLRNWRTDPDGLIDFFAQAVDRRFAEWYYETTRENIESVNVPIETYYDFCWWLFFNNSWMSILLRPLQFQTDMSVNNLKLMRSNFITWFSSIEYQQWSLVSRLGVKYGTNISERKLASKQYIYDFDHDEYYFRFKNKMESVSRTPANWCGYFCILDDYTRLTLDNDLEQILELLPEHINTDIIV